MLSITAHTSIVQDVIFVQAGLHARFEIASLARRISRILDKKSFLFKTTGNGLHHQRRCILRNGF